MARYQYTQDYRSSYGAGSEGDELDMEQEQAQSINRDAPGTLKMLRENKVEIAKAEEAIDKAADLEQKNTELKKEIKDLKAELRKANKGNPPRGGRAVQSAPHDRMVTGTENRSTDDADDVVGGDIDATGAADAVVSEELVEVPTDIEPDGTPSS